MSRGGSQFGKVRAFRFCAEGHCSAWHVEGLYDTLAEVSGSGWVSELLAAESAETWGHPLCQGRVGHAVVREI